MPATTKYDPQIVETALHVLAANAGNSVKAHEALNAQGIDVPMRTLVYWKSDKHADRYRELQHDLAPIYEARAVAHAYEVIDLTAHAEKLAVERLIEEIPNMNARDLAGTFRNISTSKGINVDNMLKLQGRPTAITEHRDTGELMRALQSLNPSLIIESTAEEDTTQTLASA